MGNHRNLSLIYTISLVAIILLASVFREAAATRPLTGDDFSGDLNVLQSLQRGPVPPSRGNPCTHIPGGSRRGRGRCTLADEVDFPASHRGGHPPETFPGIVVEFQAASSPAVNNATVKQDRSS